MPVVDPPRLPGAPLRVRRRRPGRRALALLVLALGALGVGLVVAGVRDGRNTGGLPGGVTTTAHVMSVADHPSIDYSSQGLPIRHDQYVATLTFDDAQGRTQRIEHRYGNLRPAVGRPLRISYLPDDPSHYRSLDDTPPGWLTIVAGVVLLAAVAVLAALERGRRRSEERAGRR